MEDDQLEYLPLHRMSISVDRGSVRRCGTGAVTEGHLEINEQDDEHCTEQIDKRIHLVLRDESVTSGHFEKADEGEYGEGK